MKFQQLHLENYIKIGCNESVVTRGVDIDFREIDIPLEKFPFGLGEL